jgi:hypothetical protein
VAQELQTSPKKAKKYEAGAAGLQYTSPKALLK